MDSFSHGIGLASIVSFRSVVFSGSSACSASPVHLKLLLSMHPFSVWNSGMALLADFEMKHSSVVIFPFNPCISFKFLGGLVSRRSFILLGLGCIPSLVM